MGKLKINLQEEDFYQGNSIGNQKKENDEPIEKSQNISEKKMREETSKPEEKSKSNNIKNTEVKTEMEEQNNQESIINQQNTEEQQPVKPARGRKSKTTNSVMTNATGADFLQIDIRGMRDYLSTITAYEAMKNGDKVSFNTYIRNLIEKDMKKNAETYHKFKELMKSF